jgi:poly(3-hydroxybutyrate) depolymerase
MSPLPRILSAFFVLTAISTIPSAAQKATAPTVYTMKWGNPAITRYYGVTLPPKSVPNPVMIVTLHGTRYTSTPVTDHDYGWIYTCKQAANNCIVVTPSATYDPVWKYFLWNAEFFDGGTFSKPKPPQTTYPDDIGFLRALITNLIAKYKVNPKRVYVVGFSSGAFMANRVAVQLSDLVAAVSVNSGTLDSQVGTIGVPPPLKPVSIWEFHGTADNDNVGVGPCTTSWLWNKTTMHKATVDNTFSYWTKQNSCKKIMTTKALCSGFTNNDATTCTNGTEVKFTWEPGVGHQYQTGNNNAVWTWFNAHAKP